MISIVADNLALVPFLGHPPSLIFKEPTSWQQQGGSHRGVLDTFSHGTFFCMVLSLLELYT